MKDSLTFQYKDIEIYIGAPDVKQTLLRMHPDLCAFYELPSGRKFVEGEILRVYAWDTIVEKLQRHGKLDEVFEVIYQSTKEAI